MECVKERGNLKDLHVGEGIALKWILKKGNERV
jgi:hypothetical protein